MSQEIRPSLPLDLLDRLDDPGFTHDANTYRVLHSLQRYRLAASILADLPGVDLLDVGCGECLGLRELFKRAIPLKRVLGVEIDGHVNREIAEAYGIVLLHENITAVRLEWSYDAVICYELIGTDSLSSDEELLSKLHHLCRPGGYIFLSAPHYRIAGERKRYLARIYDPDQFLALVESALPHYDSQFFGQTYPRAGGGGWPFGKLDRQANFSVAVARKPGDSSGSSPSPSEADSASHLMMGSRLGFS